MNNIDGFWKWLNANSENARGDSEGHVSPKRPDFSIVSVENTETRKYRDDSAT